MRNLNRKTVRQIQTHDYQAKPLPFRMPLPGISNRTLENHHDKLYAGYVQKKNEIETQLEKLGHQIIVGTEAPANSTYSDLRALKESETYAVNGVYLHEWYFEGLGGDGTPADAPELSKHIEESYGSLTAFIKYFSECAMAARGWTILAWDTREERLWIYNGDAHNQGGVWGCLPVIVLDVYEHAYFIDFGAERKKYIEAFWKNFNWSSANALFKRVSAIRLAS